MVGQGSDGSWLCISEGFYLEERLGLFYMALASELGPMNNIFQERDFSSINEKLYVWKTTWLKQKECGLWRKPGVCFLAGHC